MKRFEKQGTVGSNNRVGRQSRASRWFILLVSSVILHSAFPVQAATPAAVTPYTFLGRVTDARHVAFDTNRVARIAAADLSGKLLAETKTFFRAGSRLNYVLDIPMATGAADGFAVQDALLRVWVTDDVGKIWNGVIANASVGAPGAVREVDIVLGEDADGDGIDDTFYQQLKAQWEASDYWKRGETFDPNRDYDGDGVSTLAEGLSGTDPFNAHDVLTITAFSRLVSASGVRDAAVSGAPVTLSFDALGGHAYTVEEATDLKAKNWKVRDFRIESGESMNVIAFPSGSRRIPCTVYLLPTSATNAFFRIRAE